MASSCTQPSDPTTVRYDVPDDEPNPRSEDTSKLVLPVGDGKNHFVITCQCCCSQHTGKQGQTDKDNSIENSIKDGIEGSIDDSIETEHYEAETGAAQVQAIKITRISPENWRQVKNTNKVQPHLSVLLLSSKPNRRAARVGGKGHERRLTNDPKIQARVNSMSYSQQDLPYRLAINSFNLLNILENCTGTQFSEERNVLVRPFKYLVAYEAEIRKYLRDLELEATDDYDYEGGLASKQNGSNPTPHDDNGGKEKRAETSDEKLEDKNVSPARLRDELRCLVEFMDNDMRDIFKVKRKVRDATLQEVAFEHLWQVYRPGDLVYQHDSSEGPQAWQAYRITHVTGGRLCFYNRSDRYDNYGRSATFHPVRDREWDSESENEVCCRDTLNASFTSSADTTPFIIDSYFLDSDGRQIGPRVKRFVITPYEGLRAVSSLPLRPYLLDPDKESVREVLTQRGRKFVELINGAHKKYSGLSIRDSRINKSTYRSNSRYNIYRNYVIDETEINGEVVIDQIAGVESLKTEYDGFHMKFGGTIFDAPTLADIRETNDLLSSEDHYADETDVVDDSKFEDACRTEHMQSIDALNSISSGKFPSHGENLMLFPPRVYGYSLFDHKWLPLSISRVSDLPEHHERVAASSFNDLVLPHGHRLILESLIKNQVRLPDQISDEKTEAFSMDAVAGKGKGLIILLHGAPGVGKTSTAECVAVHLKRPLLYVTSGHLGTSASTTEEKLRTYCRLAQRWKCVLLLDEADVFLAKREKGDMKRNAMVSVFLRVLEYFSGVIILTTNRVGEFDEAFRSRIHITLYYPKLDKESTRNIWEKNISRIKNSGINIDIEEEKIRRFYKKFWQYTDDKPSQRWNGRQIKNAFQTAIALAKWDFYDSDRGTKLERPLLKAAHFKTVAQTSAHFDDYITDLYGTQGNDVYGDLAERDEFRKDSHKFSSSQTTQESQARRNPLGSSRSTFGPRTTESQRYLASESDEEGGDEQEDQEEERDDEDDDDDEDDLEQLQLKVKMAKLKKKQKEGKGNLHRKHDSIW